VSVLARLGIDSCDEVEGGPGLSDCQWDGRLCGLLFQPYADFQPTSRLVQFIAEKFAFAGKAECIDAALSFVLSNALMRANSAGGFFMDTSRTLVQTELAQLA